MSDWASVVPIVMVEFADVDAESEGSVRMVDMGSTGSSNRHKPSVESVETGAYASMLLSCAPRAQCIASIVPRNSPP